MKILMIGNSFSEDASAYVHQMAMSVGRECHIVNLYIGGCPLITHLENALGDLALYQYQQNGQITERMVTIREVILEDDWDVITLQQASHDSGLIETYHPYVEQLVSFVHSLNNSAKIYLHETWAYEIDSDHGGFSRYDYNQETMYQALKSNYTQVAKQLNVPIIPCGDFIQNLRKQPLFNYPHGLSLCRDGFHMQLVYGRFALGLVILKTLLGVTAESITFDPVNIDYSKYHLTFGNTHETDGEKHQRYLSAIQSACDQFVKE